jgi:hypothetical protein
VVKAVLIRVGQIALVFRSDHPIDQRSMSADLIEIIFCDLIVDRIDTIYCPLWFPLNLRHLLRRKYIKFCISKNCFMGAKRFLITVVFALIYYCWVISRIVGFCQRQLSVRCLFKTCHVKFILVKSKPPWMMIFLYHHQQLLCLINPIWIVHLYQEVLRLR